MKLIVNKGVRECMAELDRLFDRADALDRIMNDGLHSAAMDAGLDKQANNTAVIGTAARLISHATQGRRYPLMTGILYGRDSEI